MANDTSPPPESETGVEMTGDVGIGWARGSIRGLEPDVVIGALAPFLGSSTPRGGGTRWYQASATLDDRRAMVAWDGQGSAAGTVLVDVTQQAFDGLGFERGLALLRTLHGLGWRPSRLDVWADDREGLADPSDVLAALEAGQVVTHAQGHEWRSNSQGGATAYVGSRSSERFLRVYRTGPVHGYAGTRWELELKGEAARGALGLLLGDRDAATTAVQLVIAFVDFRDRVGLGHGERAARLPWWAALVGSLERVRGVAAHRVDGLARRVTWLARQVAPTLAAIWAEPAYGSAWLNGLLADGLDRLGGRPGWAST